MADMLTALNGGYGKYFKDMIPDGVSNAYNKMSSPEGLEALSRGNMLTQLIGAGIQGGQAIANYDYPKDALGWAALPAQAVTGMAKGVINQIGGTMEEAPGAAMGLNDGSQNTNLGLSMLGVGGVLSNAPRGALGANVWQGGPHKYGHTVASDIPSERRGTAAALQHMGTGENALAYGWGDYRAGAERTGEIYRRQLSTGRSEVFEDGNLVTDYDTKTLNDPRSVGLNLIEGKQRFRPHLSQSEVIDVAIKEADEYIKYDPDNAAGWAAGRDWLKENRDRLKTAPPGYLYKHDLPDEDIARYMDWDAPLSEQPESVRKALADNPILAQRRAEMQSRPHIYTRPVDEIMDSLTGQEIYDLLKDNMGAMDWPVGSDAAARAAFRGDAKKAASKELARLGIPGLKYYDGMSRGVRGKWEIQSPAENTTGKWRVKQFGGANAQTFDTEDAAKAFMEQNTPTRNYVTWDQDVLNRMKLLERNGQSMIDVLGDE